MKQQYSTMSIRRREWGGGLKLLFLLIVLLMSALVLPPATPAEASGPCDSIDWGSGGSGPTEPTFSGEVEDAASSAPVMGAEVKIFQCKSAGPVHVGTEYSDSNGAYGFAGLDAGFGYYLEVRVNSVLEETTGAHGLDLGEDFVLDLQIDG